MGMNAHAAVDMGTEFHSFAIAIEHWRIDHVRQDGADEHRIALDRRDDDALAGQRHIRALVDLLVELHRRALVARRHASVDPRLRRAVEPLAQTHDLRGVEDVGNADKHGDGRRPSPTTDALSK